MHWALSSYACELWAVYNAFAKAHCPVVCSTDCQTLAYQLDHTIRHQTIPNERALPEWWNALLNLFMLRLALAESPLVVRWIPAHVLERKKLKTSPLEAAEHRTTPLDIQMNRLAERAAKNTMNRQKASSTKGHEKYVLTFKSGRNGLSWLVQQFWKLQ